MMWQRDLKLYTRLEIVGREMKWRDLTFHMSTRTEVVWRRDLKLRNQTRNYVMSTLEMFWRRDLKLYDEFWNYVTTRLEILWWQVLYLRLKLKLLLNLNYVMNRPAFIWQDLKLRDDKTRSYVKTIPKVITGDMKLYDEIWNCETTGLKIVNWRFSFLQISY